MCFFNLCTRLYLGLSICAMVIIIGCSSDDDPIGPDEGVSADSALVLANQSLSSVMDAAINQTLENLDSTFRPRDIDFTGANALYKSALAIDPNNTDAQFGVAFTNLLVILADVDFNTLYDKFKDLVDTIPSGPVYLAPRFSFGDDNRPGVPLSTNGFADMMIDPSALESHILLAAVVDPNISDIQNILKSKFLPMIDEAITLLDKVIATDGYEFIISAEMQGNPGADGIELDRPDFRIFKATLLSVKSGLHIFFARDLDLDSYDVAGMNMALQRNSSFAGLQADGATQMASSKVALLAAADEVQLALDDLIAEITGDPDQTNDLIAVFPSDLSDLNRMKVDLADYQDFFNGPKILEIISTSGYTCDQFSCYSVKDTFSTNVDVSKFFDSPITNPKQLLPNYTLTLSEANDLHLPVINGHFDRNRYWQALINLYGTSDSLQIVDSVIRYYGAYFDLPLDGTQEFYEAVASYSSGPQFTLGWDDANWTCGGIPGKSLYCYTSSQWWVYRDFWFYPNQIASCYSWEATSYVMWDAPNPTFNGLLPDMTSLDWKETIWNLPQDWTQSQCDTFYIDN